MKNNTQTKLIKEKLLQVFPNSQFTVIDKSNLHKSHENFNKNYSTHFEIIFNNNFLPDLSRIARDQKIYQALQDEFNSFIHSLNIKWPL